VHVCRRRRRSDGALGAGFEPNGGERLPDWPDVDSDLSAGHLDAGDGHPDEQHADADALEPRDRPGGHGAGELDVVADAVAPHLYHATVVEEELKGAVGVEEVPPGRLREQRAREAEPVHELRHRRRVIRSRGRGEGGEAGAEAEEKKGGGCGLHVADCRCRGGSCLLGFGDWLVGSLPSWMDGKGPTEHFFYWVLAFSVLRKILVLATVTFSIVFEKFYLIMN